MVMSVEQIYPFDCTIFRVISERSLCYRAFPEGHQKSIHHPHVRIVVQQALRTARECDW